VPCGGKKRRFGIFIDEEEEPNRSTGIGHRCTTAVPQHNLLNGTEKTTVWFD
jgi:hypothetical protein